MSWWTITILAFIATALVCLAIIRFIGWVLEAPRRKFFRKRGRKW